MWQQEKGVAGHQKQGSGCGVRCALIFVLWLPVSVWLSLLPHERGEQMQVCSCDFTSGVSGSLLWCEKKVKNTKLV